MGPRPTMGPETTMGPSNMRSTAGEAKFTLYNEGPTCNVTISDGSNKSRVLLSKKFNTKDYVGPVVIPAGVTSLYCSSSLGKFKLISVKQGINYITLNSSGFSIDYSSALETQNYGSTAGEGKFTIYNEGPTCTITISDGSNKSRVLLNKKFNTKDYAGPIVIPADVTSLYCSSSLSKFKLFSVTKGKIYYITYTSSGFSLDLSSGSEMQNHGSTGGDTLHISLFNKSSLTRKFSIKDGSKTLFGNVIINPKENRLFNVTGAGMGTKIVVNNDLGQSIKLPIMHVGADTNYVVSYKDTGFEYLWY